MTIEKRLEELIHHGASIQCLYLGLNFPCLTLAGALWLTGPRRLRWCAIFPEHQGHLHETEYDEVKLVNDGRDLLFYENGNLKFGIVPYEESCEDIHAIRNALQKWQALLKVGNNKAEFEDFLTTA